MVIDRLVIIMFVVVCCVFYSKQSMVVLADKLMTFGLVYIVLIPHGFWVSSISEEFKFLMAGKDFMVYSLMVLLSANNILKKAYLASAIMNIVIALGFLLYSESVYMPLYDSYFILVQFITAAQIIGIVANGRVSNGDSGGGISDIVRRAFTNPFNFRLLRA